ncbi:MAG: hypothetical protein K0Q47_71 [Sedimentibacter sp.]|jgi:hypothetical protein|nr:hypothetical protein [Sedimentibacter sp.]
MKNVGRPRRSKFDPYIEEISDLLKTGLSINKVADLISIYFDDPVDMSALYAFAYSRGLDRRVTQGGTNKNYSIPNCNKCKECIKVLNTHDSEMLLCFKAKRLISKTCKTSPMWCDKRK